MNTLFQRVIQTFRRFIHLLWCKWLKWQLLAKIRTFPLVRQCCSEYIGWVCDNAEDTLDRYGFIHFIREHSSKDIEERIEIPLKSSRDILGVSDMDFCKIFRFKDDLLVNDPEKIWDILAEPFLVNDLHAQDFTQITKITRPIEIDHKPVPTADFIASLGKLKFVIELKVVRMENWIRPTKEPQFLGYANQPDWWGKMFRSNINTKIEDKNSRAIAQLDNTCESYRCDCKMLVIHSLRIGPSAVMEQNDYARELPAIKAKYPQVDFLAYKDSSGLVVFCPELPTSNPV